MREEKFTEKKSLKMSSQKTDYLNIDISLGKKCIFCGVKNHSAENTSEGYKRKRRKLVRLMLQTIDERNVRLGNALDLDLKITLLQNFQHHQKIMRNGESK